MRPTPKKHRYFCAKRWSAACAEMCSFPRTQRTPKLHQALTQIHCRSPCTKRNAFSQSRRINVLERNARPQGTPLDHSWCAGEHKTCSCSLVNPISPNVFSMFSHTPQNGAAVLQMVHETRLVLTDKEPKNHKRHLWESSNSTLTQQSCARQFFLQRHTKTNRRV